MKKLVFAFIIIGGWLHGSAQDTRSAKTLEIIINDNHNSAESRILACVRQGEFYINRPGSDLRDIDSALVSLKRGEQLSKNFNLRTTDGELLLLKGLIAKEKGNRWEGNRLNNLALAYLRKKPSNYFLGRALLEKGEYLNTNDEKQLDEKIALLKEAIPYFNDASYAKTRAATWKALGDLYGLRQENKKYIPLALNAYQRSMDAYSSFGYKNVQDIYIELADVYKTLGDDQQGLRYCLMAVQTAERARDSSTTMVQICNNTGIQYTQLLNFPMARKYYERGLRLAEKLNDRSGIFTVASSLFDCYAHDHNYGKMKELIDNVHSRFPETDILNQFYSNIYYLRYYVLLKDIINGKRYCLELAKLDSTVSPGIARYYSSNLYLPISDYYLMAHDYKNAYKYWDKAYAAQVKYDNLPSARTHFLYQHYKIDVANHDLKSGILYLRKYSELMDSIFNTSRAEQEANLQVVYDTKKQEYELAESRQQIKMLTKNEQLQRANLRQAVLIRNITIGFTLIVIIVSVLLYRMVILHKKAVRKIARTNSLLEKLVSEKEWLLREIHHRVKNNLHTVICLLESQAAYLEKDALKAIEDSRHRIYAMSLIHQKLYENENVKTIDMNDFVTALVDYLKDSYDLKTNIAFRLEIASLQIDTSIAIPIGLIINEAVTNAIKYAFAGKNGGQITIRLYEVGEKVAVVIADDGIGINMNQINDAIPSMGLRLIKGLCADIGGNIEFNNQPGTEIKVICNRVLVEDEAVNIEELLNNIPDAIES